MKKNKGFTLIELLVVIAIIGILATIVLVSLQSARQKANNAAAKAAINQVRSIAEMIYDDTSSYATLCAAGVLNAGGSYSLGTVVSDINTKVGDASITCGGTATAYCVFIDLLGGQDYCIDSAGLAKEMANAGVAGACVPGTTYDCTP